MLPKYIRSSILCLAFGYSSLISVADINAVNPQEAFDFLYTTLSLPDRTDYTEEFYRENIASSFRAREEMPWGKDVPDREFLHFVLPVRVNNEHLDMSRPVFYEELKERVKGKSMKEAILEVNHWCHEKVTYKPSDARTSSPLSAVSQAIGRCGEESTFAVAALRSVGIPARQIYTPRWAHTDDNHAWVEAWADGKWYFLGACEPEPVLDLAWFNDPASRGLLMNTNVTGDYKGPEEVLLRQPLTTRINVTSNYAPVARLDVKVTDADGKALEGVKVNFCIYNYAEFYPAVTKVSDADGMSSLTAGIGDMLVWATDGNSFGFAKGRPGGESPLVVCLDKTPESEGVFTFDIIPPVSMSSQPVVTKAQRDRNTLDLQREDSIRNAYTLTFATDSDARKIAGILDLDADEMSKILVDSRGNHKNITDFITALSPENRQTAVDLLLNVSEKDCRDIEMEVVEDHIVNVIDRKKVTDEGFSSDVYNRYVLSPRIENEYITSWRSYLSPILDKEMKDRDGEKLAEWVKKNISIDGRLNPQNLRMSPEGVMKERKTDRVSRNIFYVAAARTLGIPSRIDPVTASTQYMAPDGSWKTVEFESEESEKAVRDDAKGWLKLNFTPSRHIVDPKYYSQFSISEIKDGVARQLEFPEDGTVSTIFSDPMALEAGQYMLTTGQRLANGGVLARSEIFTISPGKTIEKELIVRDDDSAVSVIGSLNAENIYKDMDGSKEQSILSTTGRGFYVLGIVSPNHEPSAHALNDISATARQLEEAGRPIMILFDDESAASRFNKSSFPDLPSVVTLGIDKDSASKHEIMESLHLDATTGYPIFVIADTFNRIVWVSTGYTIGIGEQILSILNRI